MDSSRTVDLASFLGRLASSFLLFQTIFNLDEVEEWLGERSTVGWFAINGLSARHYSRRLKKWGKSINVEPSAYGTHSLRRAIAVQIFRKTGNLRAVRLLLGHTNIDSTVQYLGIDVEDALEISGSIDISLNRGRPPINNGGYVLRIELSLTLDNSCSNATVRRPLE